MNVTQTNQLWFDLNTRSSVSNMQAKFHTPKAIVIEKVGQDPLPQHAAPQAPTHQYTVLSEDSMNEAMMLARRDLKKQREQEQQERVTPRRASQGPSPRPSQATVHTRNYRDRQQQRNSQMQPKTAAKKKQWGGIRPTASQHSVYNQTTQAQKKPAAVHNVASSETPYKRPVDANPYRRPVDTNSQEERLAEEIKRLRAEMEISIEQVREAIDIAVSEPARPKPKYAEEIEAENKRRQRADQHNTRSSRSVYQLQQQIAAVQADIDSKSKPRPTLLQSLAAVHRGGMRTLQTLVHHLGDFKLKEEGLPRSYKELSHLLHSLHSCCGQLNVTDSTDNVLKIMEQIQELNTDVSMVNAAQKRPTSAPSKKTASPKNSPRRGRSQNNSPTMGRASKSCLKKSPHSSPGRRDSERQQAVHRAVLSLVKSTSKVTTRHPAKKRSSFAQPPSRKGSTKHPGIPPLRLPSSPRVRMRPPQGGAKGKGILMPADIQRTRRIQSQKSVQYLEPTVSSSLKIVDPADLPLTRSRSRSRSPTATERRARSLTPRRERSMQSLEDSYDMRRSRSLSPQRSFSARSLTGRSYSGRSLSGRSLSERSNPTGRVAFDAASERAMQRQAWLDKQAAFKTKQFDELRKREKRRLSELKREVDPEGHWVQEAESRIRARLEPIIGRAQLKKNADVLADSILSEVLEDTARHMGDYEDEEDLEEYVLNRTSSSSLDYDYMLERMAEMEQEAMIIRRRWATVDYEDTRVPNRILLDEIYTEPEPIFVQPGRRNMERIPSPAKAQFLAQAEEEEFMITKPRRQASTFQKSEPTPKTITARASSKIDLYLSPAMLNNINSHRAKYEQYLKNQSFQKKGKFDPWKICDEISTDIVEKCLSEVCEEMLTINDDIANHVYNVEFEKVPEGTGMSVPVPNPGFSGILDQAGAPDFMDFARRAQDLPFASMSGQPRQMFPHLGSASNILGMDASPATMNNQFPTSTSNEALKQMADNARLALESKQQTSAESVPISVRPEWTPTHSPRSSPGKTSAAASAKSSPEKSERTMPESVKSSPEKSPAQSAHSSPAKSDDHQRPSTSGGVVTPIPSPRSSPWSHGSPTPSPRRAPSDGGVAGGSKMHVEEPSKKEDGEESKQDDYEDDDEFESVAELSDSEQGSF